MELGSVSLWGEVRVHPYMHESCAERNKEAHDLHQLSVYHNLLITTTIPTRKHPLEVCWSPAMIQSGIFDFPCIYALWDRMKIGLDFS